LIVIFNAGDVAGEAAIIDIQRGMIGSHSSRCILNGAIFDGSHIAIIEFYAIPGATAGLEGDAVAERPLG